MWSFRNKSDPLISNVEISWGTDDPYSQKETVERNNQMFKITDLQPDTEYMIAAKIIYIDGQQSTEDYAKARTNKLFQPPKTPVNISGKSKSASSITVNWDVQAETSASSSRYFEIRVRNPSKKGKKRDQIIQANVFPGPQGSYVFTVEDLEPFTKYELVVRQVLDEVTSEWSMSVKGKFTKHNIFYIIMYL